MNEYPCPQYVPPSLTLDSLNILFSKITDGVKEVQYADKKVVYHSLEDMWKIYRWMQGLLLPCSTTGTPMKVAAYYDSGLNSPFNTPETSEIDWRFRR